MIPGGNVSGGCNPSESLDPAGMSARATSDKRRQEIRFFVRAGARRRGRWGGLAAGVDGRGRGWWEVRGRGGGFVRWVRFRRLNWFGFFGLGPKNGLVR
jgi:hypothetical protein